MLKQTNKQTIECKFRRFFVFVDTQVPGLGNEVGREQTWHLYYQWVAVVLLVQAFFFYIPCYLWNLWEGGRLEKLVKDLGKFYVKEISSENIYRLSLKYFTCTG